MLLIAIRYNGQYIGNVYRKEYGPIWMSNVQCTGREQHYLQCTHSGLRAQKCSHSQDVSISCFYNSTAQHAGQSLTGLKFATLLFSYKNTAV